MTHSLSSKILNFITVAIVVGTIFGLMSFSILYLGVFPTVLLIALIAGKFHIYIRLFLFLIFLIAIIP